MRGGGWFHRRWRVGVADQSTRAPQPRRPRSSPSRCRPASPSSSAASTIRAIGARRAPTFSTRRSCPDRSSRRWRWSPRSSAASSPDTELHVPPRRDGRRRRRFVCSHPDLQAAAVGGRGAGVFLQRFFLSARAAAAARSAERARAWRRVCRRCRRRAELARRSSASPAHDVSPRALIDVMARLAGVGQRSDGADERVHAAGPARGPPRRGDVRHRLGARRPGVSALRRRPARADAGRRRGGTGRRADAGRQADARCRRRRARRRRRRRRIDGRRSDHWHGDRNDRRCRHQARAWHWSPAPHRVRPRAPVKVLPRPRRASSAWAGRSPDGRTRVETLAIDDYIAQVLAGEGQPRAGDAAQQALAITARTFALANRNRHRREGFDLCDTTHCQVVRAADRDDAARRGRDLRAGAAAAAAAGIGVLLRVVRRQAPSWPRRCGPAPSTIGHPAT